MPEVRDLWAGVNKPLDSSNLVDLEKKHTPVIDAPVGAVKGQAITVTVEVGKLMAHPNEPAHFIEWVDLYEDRLFLARAELTPAKVNPKVTFSVVLAQGGTLRAFARCNIHGVWEGDRAITVR
jgi:superoxide reductase